MANDMTLINVTLIANKVRCIEYTKPYTLNIQNLTGGALFVSYNEEFGNSDDIGEYIRLKAGDSYNGLRLRSGRSCIYFKADNDGTINIVAGG